MALRASSGRAGFAGASGSGDIGVGRFAAALGNSLARSRLPRVDGVIGSTGTTIGTT